MLKIQRHIFSTRTTVSFTRSLSQTAPFHISSSINRTMSTEAPKKHEFIIILPDQEGALERRMEVRGYVVLRLCVCG
jgi:broad-specificity NMP kinase